MVFFITTCEHGFTSLGMYSRKLITKQGKIQVTVNDKIADFCFLAIKIFVLLKIRSENSKIRSDGSRSEIRKKIRDPKKDPRSDPTLIRDPKKDPRSEIFDFGSDPRSLVYHEICKLKK